MAQWQGSACGGCSGATSSTTNTCKVVVGKTGSTNVTFTPNSTLPANLTQPKHVVVTPLPVISKILLKTVNKGSKNKKVPKTFTLRNVPVGMKTCQEVKFLIRAQLHGDIIKDDFDVGYLQGSTVISLRSAEDLKEVWESVKSGKNITMWCDGLKSTKAKRTLDLDSDDEGDDEGEIMGTRKKRKKSRRKTKQKETDERVEQILTDLQEKHSGSSYTPFQLRIWAEMIAGGVHTSYDESPATTMFLRAGSVGNAKKKKVPATNMLSDAITQLSSALSPRPTSSGSPAKVIDNRSKCYKQLSEVNSPIQQGVLSEEEGHIQRNAIMAILNAL